MKYIIPVENKLRADKRYNPFMFPHSSFITAHRHLHAGTQNYTCTPCDDGKKHKKGKV